MVNNQNTEGGCIEGGRINRYGGRSGLRLNQISSRSEMNILYVRWEVAMGSPWGTLRHIVERLLDNRNEKCRSCTSENKR